MAKQRRTVINLCGVPCGFDATSKDRSLRQLLPAEIFLYTLNNLSKRVVILFRNKSRFFVLLGFYPLGA